MVGIGIGIGLGMGGRPRQSSAAEKTIKAALKERHHLSAIRGGVRILVQPYALLNAQGARILHCVVVLIDGEARGDWSPVSINVAELGSLEVNNETFIPSDAFDPATLSGVIAVVERFDPFQNAGEQVPGQG